MLKSMPAVVEINARPLLISTSGPKIAAGAAFGGIPRARSAPWRGIFVARGWFQQQSGVDFNRGQALISTVAGRWFQRRVLITCQVLGMMLTVHVYASIHAFMHPCMNGCMDVRKQTCMHAWMHAWVQAWMHPCIHVVGICCLMFQYCADYWKTVSFPSRVETTIEADQNKCPEQA